MPPQIAFQSYGKSKVRVSHIRRDGDRHEFIELSCSIELQGDFDAAYTSADNSLIVPTDTMKNTVYALAGRHGIESAESFARRLAQHFLKKYPQVATGIAKVEESPWERMTIADNLHNHAFVGSSGERNHCDVMACRETASEPAPKLVQTGGLSGLKVLKTTGSAFTGFHTDELTTLKPTDDRILATTIDVGWVCLEPEADWRAIRQSIRCKLLEVFATSHSESVQQTLYDMAERILAAHPEMESVSLTMPNQHHLLVDLAPFGIDNFNQVFVPTDEPFGNISAMITRGEVEPPA